MASVTKLPGTNGDVPEAPDGSDDPFRIWRDIQEPTGTSGNALIATRVATPDAPSLPTSNDLRALADLDDPRLVLSETYVGIDRRRAGVARALARTVHLRRRSLLRLDVLVVLAVAVLVAGAVLLLSTSRQTDRRAGASVAAGPTGPLVGGRTARPATATATAPTTGPSDVRSSVPTTAPPGPPASTVAAPAPVITTIPPAAPANPAPAAAPAVDLSSPQSMGTAALALVRYPWQQLPGYSIRFAPISEAPSPGFYGNTNFTWGRPGGVSTLYVYPGETVDQLAGITAFEIGHEVDAAYVEPQGGHDQIAGILGLHPASWAPQCDCAEQGYLSGWYAAAFSDYWSPGVGAWSSIAPPPGGAVLAAVRPWLDPRVS